MSEHQQAPGFVTAAFGIAGLAIGYSLLAYACFVYLPVAMVMGGRRGGKR